MLFLGISLLCATITLGFLIHAIRYERKIRVKEAMIHLHIEKKHNELQSWYVGFKKDIVDLQHIS